MLPDERHLPHQVSDTPTDDERLMRYATAIARNDIDYMLGTDYPLPGLDHDFWKIWKRIATVAIQIADHEHPPPPGSTLKKLPDHILALIVLRPYISTACETARALESAVVRHPDFADELRMYRDLCHKECRLNNKFTDVECGCPHPHRER
jgi:hypothetical protein